MPNQVTLSDASNYILNSIEYADDDSLLTVTLTRLAIICAGLPAASRWLELFEREFRLERGRLRLAAAMSVAKRIQPS